MSAGRPDKNRHLTVIGAGIVGVITALRAQQRGFDVTIIDRLEPGRGCSFANGAAISPDFCVPIAAPDMLKKVPRWLLDPDGPLYLRWSQLPKAAPYLVNWARQSRTDAVLHNASAMRALHVDGLKEYADLLGDAAGSLIEAPGAGMVWRAPTPKPGGALAHRIYETYGVEVRIVGPKELRDLDPNLSTIYNAGLVFPAAGHTTNPYRLVATLAELMVRNGGNIVHADVRALETAEAKVTSLVTASGTRSVDQLVIAAGIDSLGLARSLGDRPSMIGERGYYVMLPDPGVVPPLKISDRDRMFGLSPLETGLRVSGTVEIDRPDAPMNEARAHSLLAHALTMYPKLNARGAQFGMGVRPTTPDSLPYVGRATHFANVHYAFGHGHFGLNGAPATGRIIADLLSGQKPAIDPAPYSPRRFSAHQETTVQ